MNRKIGVVYSFLLMLFEIFSTLILTPFVIQTLGQSEYGVYKLVASLNSYLLLLDLGVGNAIIRYISKYRAENNNDKIKVFLGITTIYYIIISVLTIIIGIILVISIPYAFVKGLNSIEISLAQKLLFIMIINTILVLLSTTYSHALIAYERFSVSKGVSILSVIIRIIAVYYILHIGLGSFGIVCVNLGITVINKTFVILYVIINLKLLPNFNFKTFDFSMIKEIIIYTSYILLQVIATQLNSSVDQILIGICIPVSAIIIGIYSIGTQITQYFLSLGSAFNGVLMPGIMRLFHQNPTSEQLTAELIKISRIIFMVLFFAWGVFATQGKSFVQLWAGKNNISAYYVAFILMMVYSFSISSSIGSQMLWAINKHKYQAIMKIGIVISNVILTIFLIKINALYGATIGTFLSLLLGDVFVMMIIFHKELKINVFMYVLKTIKGIMPCVFIVILVGIIINPYFKCTWGGLIIKVLILTFVYGIIMFSWGMNNYERLLVLSFMKNKKFTR